MSNDALEQLCRALRNCDTLRELDVSENSWVPKDSSDRFSPGLRGAKILAEHLRVSSSLTVLSMHSLYVGAHGGQILGIALRNHGQHLVKLDVSTNLMENVGAAYLLSALPGNTVLTALNLSKNRMSGGVIQHVMLYCTALQHLSLANNVLGNRATLRIVQWCQYHTLLQTLNLNKCNVCVPAVQALGLFLGTHPTLRFLNLGRNNLKITACKHLWTVLRLQKADRNMIILDESLNLSAVAKENGFLNATDLRIPEGEVWSNEQINQLIRDRRGGMCCMHFGTRFHMDSLRTH